tara:strand:+ start:1275 stop:1802 length:528 start_codon:yes stop_codon:yes gene_type:complete
VSPYFLGAGLAALVVLFIRQKGAAAVSIERQDTLEGLHPEFLPKLQQLLDRLKARGFKPWVYETHRTAARQDWLYASGRTRPGPIVTNVDGKVQTGKGHGAGKAADIIDGRAHPTRSGQRVGWGTWSGQDGDETAAEMAEDFFRALGEEAEALGLTWGGRWTLSGGGKDMPHVQL